MENKQTPLGYISFSVFAWIVGLLIFFPIFWMVLTSFKTELEAVSIPPSFISFDWTLENYAEVQERSNYFKFAMNSVISSSPAVRSQRQRSPPQVRVQPARSSEVRGSILKEP